MGQRVPIGSAFGAHLKAVVRPAAEFHLATLIVERKPSDINFACRFKDSRWHIQARAIVSYDDVGWKCAVKSFIGTASIIEEVNLTLSH